MGNRIYLASPTMHQEEQVFIQEAFDTNWVAPLGKNVDEFEKGVAEFVGGVECGNRCAASGCEAGWRPAGRQGVLFRPDLLRNRESREL